MRLVVNDSAVADVPSGPTTVEGLLDALRERGDIGRDQVVVALQVDDRPWAADDMDRAASASLEGVRDVAVQTSDLRGYARRILADADSTRAVLQEAARQVAAGLREGSPDGANAHLFSLLDALQRFLACLVHVQNACGLDRAVWGPSDGAMEQMSDGLESMRLSQEQQDWAALADHLEERFVPALETIGGVIDRMKGEL
jgi:hypothetical protein